MDPQCSSSHSEPAMAWKKEQAAQRPCTRDGLHERRRGVERRHRHLQAFFYQFFRAQRVGERRADHAGAHFYVDVHGAPLLLTILLILLMSVADAHLTLVLLGSGGDELNPLMRMLIEHDVRSFVFGKYVITAGSLMLLLMHKNVTLLGSVSGMHVLFAILLAYALLIGYEIRLVSEANLHLWG